MSKVKHLVKKRKLVGSTIEKHTYWIGRVHKIRKKYGKVCGRSREPVDLLDKPKPRLEVKGSTC